ncbi:hypothetical protein AK812_SmicGene37885 [Symbiodinium microadriaticum]|uniref:Uncharacterized protein n=1 Tax=Symbiodinium microadriaticum TaxID=2951 RepID=A0A1Q9CF75_SYMMI|nr:hypothetical protein AK812_SmicGene37885 [Symbiodinium microadriaticum]CAE7373739.1 unnamed protein product [Symbiodinium microadriaticum]
MHQDLCMICYSTISEADGASLEPCKRAALESSSAPENDEACPQVHRVCLSKYLIIQAEDGKFPCTCPFCLRPLSLREIHRSLSPRACRAWLRLHNLWRELRELPRQEQDHTNTLEVEEVRMMQDFGCRRCPRCGVWIEKQEPGWLTGCDKMTCRCGGRFCFRCGSVEAQCSCSLGHDFIEQESVAADYADLHLPWPISELFREGTKVTTAAESGATSDEASASSTGVGSNEVHSVAGAGEECRADETVPLGMEPVETAGAQASHDIAGSFRAPLADLLIPALQESVPAGNCGLRRETGPPSCDAAFNHLLAVGSQVGSKLRLAGPSSFRLTFGRAWSYTASRQYAPPSSSWDDAEPQGVFTMGSASSSRSRESPQQIGSQRCSFPRRPSERRPLRMARRGFSTQGSTVKDQAPKQFGAHIGDPEELVKRLQKKWNGTSIIEALKFKLKEYEARYGVFDENKNRHGDKELAILQKVVEDGEVAESLQPSERATLHMLQHGLRDYIDFALDESLFDTGSASCGRRMRVVALFVLRVGLALAVDSLDSTEASEVRRALNLDETCQDEDGRCSTSLLQVAGKNVVNETTGDERGCRTCETSCFDLRRDRLECTDPWKQYGLHCDLPHIAKLCPKTCGCCRSCSLGRHARVVSTVTDEEEFAWSRQGDPTYNPCLKCSIVENAVGDDMDRTSPPKMFFDQLTRVAEFGEDAWWFTSPAPGGRAFSEAERRSLFEHGPQDQEVPVATQQPWYDPSAPSERCRTFLRKEARRMRAARCRADQARCFIAPDLQMFLQTTTIRAIPC